jgi:hypothetical protein
MSGRADFRRSGRAETRKRGNEETRKPMNTSHHPIAPHSMIEFFAGAAQA